MSRVTLAKSAGFCYGVERAVDLAEKAVEQGRAYLLGPVIPNANVVAERERKGAVLVHRVEEVPPGARVILRSHGEARAVHDALREKGCQVVDTACPNVTRIHRLVERAEAAGRQPAKSSIAMMPSAKPLRILSFLMVLSLVCCMIVIGNVINAFLYDVSCADFCCVQTQKIPYKNRVHPPEGFHSKKPLPADFSLRQRLSPAAAQSSSASTRSLGTAPTDWFTALPPLNTISLPLRLLADFRLTKS